MVSCQALFGFYSITLQKEATTHRLLNVTANEKKIKYEKTKTIWGS